MATVNPIASTTVAAPSAHKYERGHLLGRSGHYSEGADRLLEVASHLDALLCVLGDQDVDEIEDQNGFQRFNPKIQRSVLNLAQSLAEEAHELAMQLHGFREHA